MIERKDSLRINVDDRTFNKAILMVVAGLRGSSDRQAQGKPPRELEVDVEVRRAAKPRSHSKADDRYRAEIDRIQEAPRQSKSMRSGTDR